MFRIGSHASGDPGKQIAAHAAVVLAIAASVFASIPCFAAKPIAADEYLPADQNPQQTCRVSFWNVDKDGKDKWYGRCSGTVIAPTVILTAEHCRNAARVTAKTTVTCSNGETRTVTNHIGHPKSLDEQDLAVFKFDEPLSVPPMKIVQSADEQKQLMSKPEKCIIAGWGRTSLDGHGGALHAAYVSELVPDYVDLSTLSVHRNQIRINGKSQGQPGDSGGSLICPNESGERILVAVLSAYKKELKFSEAEMIVPSLEWIRYTTGPLGPVDNSVFDGRTQYAHTCRNASECLGSFEPTGKLTSSVLRIMERMRKDLVKLEGKRADAEKKASGDPMERDWLGKKYEKLQSDMLALYRKCKSRLEKLTASP
ncbi:MAG: trypsin-like serine protease [Deltaproteobacteria bacterium]|nr:trypsin-like serine protease [Deltaproteobacteria bacterium]